MTTWNGSSNNWRERAMTLIAIEQEQRRRKAPPAPTFRGANLALQSFRGPEVMLSGSAECVSGDTKIYDPMTGISTPIRDLAERGRPITVLTMSGPQTIAAPFHKGRAPLYRVTMVSGRSFLATARHRLLTGRGWTYVADLAAGLSVPSSSPILPVSIAGVAPSAFPQGDRDWSRTPGDCQDGYVAYSRQYDERPHQVSGTDQGYAPLRADAHEHSYADLHAGDWAFSGEHSRLYRSFFRHASADFAPSASPYRETYTESCVSECTPLHAADWSESPAQCLLGFHQPQPSHEWLYRSWLLPTLSMPFDISNTVRVNTVYSYYTVRQDTVSSVVYEQTGDYYDMTVPGAAHYFAEGYWHHNTGKTWACLWYLDAFLRSYAGAQGALIRKKRVTIGPTVLRTYLAIQALHRTPAVPYGGNNPQWYDYANGSRLWIGGIDDPGKMLSGERDIAYVNQAEELDVADWETITTRTTGRGSVAPYTITLGDCNPGPADHWIIGRRAAGSLTFLESHHEDNPSLHDGTGWTAQGRKSLAALDRLTGIRKQRLRYGLWVGAEGAYYTQLDADLHLVDYAVIPYGWDVWGSLDYGFTHPLSFGVFGSYEDQVVLFGRHSADHWYIPQHAAAMDSLLDGLGVRKRGLRIVAGHDCWNGGKDDPETIADTFDARGYRLERAIISRIIGARAIGERLGNPECTPPIRPTLHFNTRSGGRAVFDCLARMIVDPNQNEDVLKVNATNGQGGDDDYDMLRYGVMASGGRRSWNADALKSLSQGHTV